MGRRLFFLFLVIVIAAGGVWAFFHFKPIRQHAVDVQNNFATTFKSYDSNAWYAAVDKVRADRAGEGAGALEIPPELKHYEERYWFLATQVAEIDKYSVHTCQDYLDLAATIERGELVPVPGVTDNYVLIGIGQRADDSPFDSSDDALVTLAKNFNGRSYNLDDAADRLALKQNMLCSLRPQALKILDEVAAAYHKRFDRPLPVSSLVRPEQYQHSLRRVNRNAVTIDAPPHSTGLAFDIDYRYMSAAEQNFVMDELARIKREGRIEVIRERNANYHVFAFLDGVRPSDDLISASLEKAGAPPEQDDDDAATAKTEHVKTKSKPRKAAHRQQKSVHKTRKHRR